MKSPTTNQPLSVWRMRAVWLAAISALASLCLAAVTGQQAGPGFVESNALQIEGSWSVTVSLNIENGPSPFESVVSYGAGGVVIASDPSVYSLYGMKVAQTAYHGAWARNRGGDFTFTVVGYQWDETVDPPVLWKGIIKEAVTLEPGGDIYNGKGTVEWYYPDGTFAGANETTTHGTRIKAQ